MRIFLPQMHFLLLLLWLVVVAVAVVVVEVVVVLVAVILIVIVVNSISSSCGSSKILTWTGKYKLGARAGGRVWGPGPGPEAKQRGWGPGNTKTLKNQLTLQNFFVLGYYLYTFN